MKRLRLTATVTALATASSLAGCVTTHAPADKPTARGVTVKSDGQTARAQSATVDRESGVPVTPSTPPRPAGPDVLAGQEPCAARLHDVAGVMLFYYALHKRLPAELEDLRTVADTDQALEFTCPASGRPYVYVPAGLRYPGKDERLVLYDADPAHAGSSRWGILAAPPKGERPAAMWAVQLSEAAMETYLASAKAADGS
jgi:hypothetical protein